MRWPDSGGKCSGHDAESSTHSTMTEGADRSTSGGGGNDRTGRQPARLPDALRLGHVRLQVSDLERSLAYYTSVLGLEGRRIDRTCRIAFQRSSREICAAYEGMLFWPLVRIWNIWPSVFSWV